MKRPENDGGQHLERVYGCYDAIVPHSLSFTIVSFALGTMRTGNVASLAEARLCYRIQRCGHGLMANRFDNAAFFFPSFSSSSSSLLPVWPRLGRGRPGNE